MVQYGNHLLKYIHLYPLSLLVFLGKNHHLTAPLWKGELQIHLYKPIT